MPKATQQLRNRPQRGTTAVELALLLPSFLLLTMGTIEVGRIWWTSQTLTAAARSGASAMSRPVYSGAGMQPPSEQSARNAARAYLQLAGIDITDDQVAEVIKIEKKQDAQAFGGGAKCRVFVTINYDFDSILPALIEQAVSDNGIRLQGVCAVESEYWPTDCAP